MKTIIDRLNETVTIEQNRKAVSKCEVLHEGLFGAYHYKIDKYEFEMHSIQGKKHIPSWWTMNKNGVKTRIKFKYVFYLTMKKAGIL